MERNADNAGWAFFATVFGLMTAPHWLAQFGVTMLTLVVGLVVTHFVKEGLKRFQIWWDKRQEADGD